MGVWRLETQSFVGVLAYATHYMGTLHRPWQPDVPNTEQPGPITVESMLEPERAEALSTEDFEYKPGVECERYVDHESMVEAAISQFLRLAEPGDVLVSNFDYLTGRYEDEPERVLASKTV